MLTIVHGLMLRELVYISCLLHSVKKRLKCLKTRYVFLDQHKANYPFNKNTDKPKILCIEKIFLLHLKGNKDADKILFISSELCNKILI